jgi:cell division protein FtsI/penicillin-binding protein 2
VTVRSASDEIRNVGRARVRIVLVAVVLVGVFLGVRAVQLSVIGNGALQAIAAEGDGPAETEANVGRGDIVSADGRKLATTVEAVLVVATPYQISDPQATAQRLYETVGSATGKTEDDLLEALTHRGEDGKLAGYSEVCTVEPAVAQEVRELEIEGLATVSASRRVYPEAHLASQITGHVGDYDDAFGGIEARYDETLRSGENLEVTLDSAVQEELEDALEGAVRVNEAKSALGIVLRVDNGAIVALANSPGYDNNRFGDVAQEMQRDRVLTDPYEPGSTFKAFTVAAALEEGAVAEDSVFTVPDEIQVADRVIHDSVPHVVETMKPEEILQRSSNVGAVQIAQSLGGEDLERYIRLFGFGRATGVDLWGEDPGDVPEYADWSGSSIGNIPIGQGMTATPLQLAAGYATLANGGRAIVPYVARRDAPQVGGERVISEGTSDIVRGMLQSAVDDGTGNRARIPGYTVAGKTGTSQKVDPKTGTYGGEYMASFVGFAPASEPEYVTLVVVDEPQASIWGEEVAAPAFRKVMSFTLSYFNVPSDSAGTTSP